MDVGWLDKLGGRGPDWEKGGGGIDGWGPGRGGRVEGLEFFGWFCEMGRLFSGRRSAEKKLTKS